MAAALGARAPDAAGSIGSGRKSDRLAVTAVETEAENQSGTRRRADAPGMQLASLETGAPSDSKIAKPDALVLPADASFDDRFFFDPRLASFEERYGVTGVRGAVSSHDVTDSEADVAASPAGARAAAAPPNAPSPAGAPTKRAEQKVAMLTPARLEPPAKERARDGGAARQPPASDIDGRTAVYDISAGAVYLPDGRKLEAHSGLGNHMDDPRAVSLKGRGPTPPNAYRLVMRERLFHGVRAIRLIPADESRMHGRDGILAHSYLLGANGQSNGCVSFSDYPTFLDAFLKGDVDRLVVVERLERAPTPKSGPGWLAQAIGNLFKPSDRAATPAPGEDRGTALSYQ